MPTGDGQGWWLTGDAAVLTETPEEVQQLRLRGRMDGAIAFRGETGSPDLLSERRRHQAQELPLDAALLLPVDSAEWDERLVALVRCSEMSEVSGGWPALQSRLQQITACWMAAERPLAWYSCADLEPSTAGKWQRQRWQLWLQSQELDLDS